MISQWRPRYRPSEEWVAKGKIADARNPALDGLRGIAILMVMIYHYLGVMGFASGPAKILHQASRYGWAGVDLFFALSGFLITGILWEARRTDARSYFVNFYARRSLRILPPAYALLVGILIAGAIIPSLHTSGYGQFVKDQPWFWLYGVNICQAHYGFSRFEYDWFDLNMFWTLAVEEHFYLIWPLAMFRGSRRTLMGVAAGIALASTALRAGWTPLGTGWADAFLATPRQSMGLACGAFAALAVEASVRPHLVRITSGVAILAGFGTFLATIAAGHGHQGWWMEVFGKSGLGFAGLVTLVAKGEIALLVRAMSKPTLVFFGKYSYGIYLYHFTFYFTHGSTLKPLFGSYTLGMIAFLFCSFAISIGMALLSWNILEQPALRLKRYFRYGPALPNAGPAIAHREVVAPATAAEST